MKVFPLEPVSFEEAKQFQFKLVEAISSEFQGTEMFQLGDVGVARQGMPVTTRKVERVLASFFGCEDCALVRGAGTGAIRNSLAAYLEPGDVIAVHNSPIYTTTKETLRMMGIECVSVDLHDDEAVKDAVQRVKLLYVQHTRQQPGDRYSLEHVIQTAKAARPEIPVIIDENYAVFKTQRIGVQMGADISTFSAFKLLGPEGIGVVLGSHGCVDTIHQRNYSGGGQVQGHEAMELLRALTMAPVLIAVQIEQVQALCDSLNDGAVPAIVHADIANAQSRTVIAQLNEPIAADVVAAVNEFGGASYPVGAESKYEVLPMIYRVSGSFCESAPDLKPYLLRINPMRASAGLVVDILNKAISKVMSDHA
ncbi:aminotransferase class V-fold PLP-dependent enzyme [Alicyclobacillus fastidiosus]|uniref:Aminotransferase class V-fold PLP-dependent enzyme n=1 Tax=Alicyclobacillus fastidiosus TaxID=392011 RepID=A0ABV5AGI4_9BACL|nr:aminotransferase class V-fold PLP-dependent enzyme [Alicyclobacillus fastidiosus]WEH08987.1 aminotransferase class V-fold PLP-dependent enzyme [Alicyclobacillus fastidiosus]